MTAAKLYTCARPSCPYRVCSHNGVWIHVDESGKRKERQEDYRHGLSFMPHEARPESNEVLSRLRSLLSSSNIPIPTPKELADKLAVKTPDNINIDRNYHSFLRELYPGEEGYVPIWPKTPTKETKMKTFALQYHTDYETWGVLVKIPEESYWRLYADGLSESTARDIIDALEARENAEAGGDR